MNCVYLKSFLTLGILVMVIYMVIWGPSESLPRVFHERSAAIQSEAKKYPQ